MNNTHVNNNRHTPTSLEEIREMKLCAYDELQLQKKALAKSAHRLIAPFTPAVHKGNSLMRAFNTGMMAFDGVMLGIKLMRKFRRAFR